MQISDFDYELPPELIAQEPAAKRDDSRLLVVNRRSRELGHSQFADLQAYLRPDDVLVLNDSRVIPARLRGLNPSTGGQFELLLLEETGRNEWWVMVRPGKRAPIGAKILIRDVTGSEVWATVERINADGHRKVRFSGSNDIIETAERAGEIPLPPYIQRPPGASSAQDRERYQTVYARPKGSVAAPTAGLHFTPERLEDLQKIGVKVCYVTLHVGPGTFAPVKTSNPDEHTMHEERFELNESTARVLNETKVAGGRVFAVGTTSLRVLETVANIADGPLAPTRGRTRLFVRPPHHFRVVDALLTNFHQPRSTLMMLVSAFASPGDLEGIALIRRAYEAAIANRYRFFSYGDAMLIL